MGSADISYTLLAVCECLAVTSFVRFYVPTVHACDTSTHAFFVEFSPLSGRCPRIFEVQVPIHKSSYLPLIHLVLLNPAFKKRKKETDFSRDPDLSIK